MAEEADWVAWLARAVTRGGSFSSSSKIIWMMLARSPWGPRKETEDFERREKSPRREAATSTSSPDRQGALATKSEGSVLQKYTRLSESAKDKLKHASEYHESEI